jgi:hypothetical protein
MAMGERNSLCERIRNAKTNLANAEQSFKENRDVRGELDLMLAEAEMKNLKKQHQIVFCGPDNFLPQPVHS